MLASKRMACETVKVSLSIRREANIRETGSTTKCMALVFSTTPTVKRPMRESGSGTNSTEEA